MERQLHNLTLELSAKALRAPANVGVAVVAATMFQQWRALADRASQVSVLLWISDGGELLDWSGDLADTFEWACWVGCANPLPPPEKPTSRQRRDTHRFPRKVFAEEVCAPLPYSWLRETVAAIRAAARVELGREIRVGTILDAGPEFAVSDFKFRRHQEAMAGKGLFPKSFLSCSSPLHADSRRYAAFPDGIPDGTSFGAFLGAQYREFSRTMGFDYLWLSNGLGFGDEPWGIVGALFDGERFHPERASAASARMAGFWRDFFAACPGAVVETRGSNFSAGVEIASDAAPLGELYAKGLIEPPVNSPWAALNFNTGLELAAWMSHVAELPVGRGFPFRFYIHDPWFLNSPWDDRYAREPWDIYAPLSVARMKEDGSVQTPDGIALLSVDDTLGRMPEKVPREVVPHLLEAFETAPDRPGPLIWVYPFEEYSRSHELERIFNEDLFLGESLQGGLPLNTVCSTRAWRALAHPTSVSSPDVFALPVSALLSAENLAALDAWESLGARFLVYGSLADASDALLARLGLALTEPLEGEAAVRVSPDLPGDVFAVGAPCDRFFVRSVLDDGGLCEVPERSRSCTTGSDKQHRVPPTVILATAEFPGGRHRVLASHRGAFAYVRSALPLSADDKAMVMHFSHVGATGAFPVERLVRLVAGAAFGWSIRAVMVSSASLPPRLNVHRHDNAFLFHAFTPDTTAALRVRTPLGAPLLTEHETLLDGGEAVWHPSKSWRGECRFFVEGQTHGVISVKTDVVAFPGYSGCFQIRGLEKATLRFFPPNGFDKTIELVHHEFYRLAEDFELPEREETSQGICAVWSEIDGPVVVAW